MKLKLLLLGLAAAANVFVAIRFRQPTSFVIAGAIVAVMIYCYLTGAKKDKSQSHRGEYAKYGKDVVLTEKGDGCYDMAFKFSLLYKEGIVWRKALPETTVNPLRFMRKC
mgnify:CR=1 FL=1